MEKLNTILLVDDSLSSNEYNKAVLLEMGITKEVVIKNSVDSAISYLKGNDTSSKVSKPEIIFLDIKMPQKDGFEFMEEYIKLGNNLTNNYNIKICILSDYLNLENFEKAKEFKSFGLVDHIKKPIEVNDIQNLIEEQFYG